MDLNSVKLKNMAIAAVFAAGSLAALGYTTLVISELSSAREVRVQIEGQLQSRFQASCKKSLEGLEGFKVVAISNTVRAVKTAPISDPNYDLALVTGSMQSCSGYKLENFCMGSGCKNPLEIKLKQG